MKEGVASNLLGLALESREKLSWLLTESTELVTIARSDISLLISSQSANPLRMNVFKTMRTNVYHECLNLLFCPLSPVTCFLRQNHHPYHSYQRVQNGRSIRQIVSVPNGHTYYPF